jgi:hypothetical protein
MDASRVDSDDDSLVPAQVPRKRRLQRVALDSDDDDFEELGVQDGGHTLQSAAVEAQASDEATVPRGPLLPSEQTEADDEIDAILDIELDVGDEVGEGEFILGPDDDDDDDNEDDDMSGEVPTDPLDAIASRPLFEDLLRQTLVQLVTWAKENELQGLDGAVRSVALCYWVLLRRVSVDFLVALFLPAISLEVQCLFEKKDWSLEDMLSLPHVGRDRRQGKYCDFATGDIARRSTIGCEAYVGSARSLRERTLAHSHMAESYTVDDLPKKHKKSFHYRQICRSGVERNFRKLAAFNCPVETGYLLLLEGVFMILFKTFNHPGYVSNWATSPAYDLVKEIRSSLRVPDVPWRGMNAAWPLCQGFKNRTSSAPSPCCNPECSTMTYPQSSGKVNYCREHGDPTNPLGPYLCGICSRYRKWHGVLPDANILAKFVERLQTREAAGEDAACACCGRLESQFDLHAMTSRLNERVFYVRKHRIHPNLPHTYLCGACYYFLEDKGRLHTPEEVQQLLSVANLIAARAEAQPVPCSNCGAIEGRPGCRGKHIANGKTGNVLCRRCDSYLGQEGRLRDPRCQRALELRLRVTDNRNAGRAVICVQCGKLETEHMRTFTVSKFGIGPLCHTIACQKAGQQG